MKGFLKSIKISLLLFILFLQCAVFSHGYEFKFKKNQQQKEEKKLKVPETKEQWLIESKDIPPEERILKEEEQKTDEKQYVPDLRYIFEKYNYPQGSRKLNISDIKKNLTVSPPIVADVTCHYVAYVKYYFSPDINQISSNFYIGELDTSKTKQERILTYKHNQKERTPIIEAGTRDLYQNLRIFD